ncbi:MAG: hypothetical protein AAB656_01090 [Patescibacteria group bacterium]
MSDKITEPLLPGTKQSFNLPSETPKMPKEDLSLAQSNIDMIDVLTQRAKQLGFVNTNSRGLPAVSVANLLSAEDMLKPYKGKLNDPNFSNLEISFNLTDERGQNKVVKTTLGRLREMHGNIRMQLNKRGMTDEKIQMDINELLVYRGDKPIKTIPTS